MQKIREQDTSLHRLIGEAKAFPDAASQGARFDWRKLDASIEIIRNNTEFMETALADDSVDPRKNWKTILPHDAQVETRVEMSMRRIRRTQAESWTS